MLNRGIKTDTVEPGFNRNFFGPFMLNLDIKETEYSGNLDIKEKKRVVPWIPLYPGTTVPTTDFYKYSRNLWYLLSEFCPIFYFPRTSSQPGNTGSDDVSAFLFVYKIL